MSLFLDDQFYLNDLHISPLRKFHSVLMTTTLVKFWNQGAGALFYSYSPLLYFRIVLAIEVPIYFHMIL
jgi:hypothetical protein